MVKTAAPIPGEVALVVMGTMYVLTEDHTSDSLVSILLTGVSLAVAAVPEGLVAILSLVLAIGVRAMEARNAVMKDLHSVETLGSTSVICTDKTGTLTRNEMTLRRIVTASGRVGVAGSGYVPEGETTIEPVAIDADSLDSSPADPQAALVEARVLHCSRRSGRRRSRSGSGSPAWPWPRPCCGPRKRSSSSRG